MALNILWQYIGSKFSQGVLSRNGLYTYKSVPIYPTNTARVTNKLENTLAATFPHTKNKRVYFKVERFLEFIHIIETSKSNKACCTHPDTNSRHWNVIMS